MIINVYQTVSICILLLLCIIVLIKYMRKHMRNQQVNQGVLEELRHDEGLPDNVGVDAREANKDAKSSVV
jgi:hypothetical protein